MLQDIIIGILLLFGLVSGFISGGIKKGLRLVITLGIFFGCYFALKDLAVDFLRYDLLSYVTQGRGIQVEVDPTLTIQVMNLEDLFILLQNADENLTGLQLKTTCEVLCTVLTFVVMLFATELISFPISFLLYHLVFKFLFFRVGKKPKIFGRTIGAVIGVIEVLIFSYFYVVSFGQLGCIFQEALAIIQAIPAESRAPFESVLPLLEEIVSSISYESSIILSGIINAITGTGIDPFALVSVTIEGTKEKVTLPKAIQGIHDAAFDSIVGFIEQIFSGNNAPTNPGTGPEEAAQLYNLGFNF